MKLEHLDRSSGKRYITNGMGHTTKAEGERIPKKGGGGGEGGKGREQRGAPIRERMFKGEHTVTTTAGSLGKGRTLEIGRWRAHEALSHHRGVYLRKRRWGWGVDRPGRCLGGVGGKKQKEAAYREAGRSPESLLRWVSCPGNGFV